MRSSCCSETPDRYILNNLVLYYSRRSVNFSKCQIECVRTGELPVVLFQGHNILDRVFPVAYLSLCCSALSDLGAFTGTLVDVISRMEIRSVRAVYVPSGFVSKQYGQ